VTLLIILPEAEEELREAADFLESRSPGMEHRLLADLERTIQRVIDHPNIGPPVGSGARKIRLRDFPYDLIYRIDASSLLVVSVAHHRRDPKHWRDRL
jgi:plasmid stabilization system protein ParE